MNLPQNLTFNQIISSVSLNSQFKNIIASAEKLYLVKSLALQTLNPVFVTQWLNRKTEKIKTTLGNDLDSPKAGCELTWALNEYKIFVWISVCYAYTQRKEIQQFENEDFEVLKSIFPRKPLQFIEYHLKNLLKQFKNVREKWTEKEDELLADIANQQTLQRMNDRNCIKWSEISYKLFEYSEKQFFRTPQKCRERWFNYLAPEVNHTQWTNLQDLQLIKSAIRHGTKWALISKLFSGTRTQHMIKNRYNALVKQYHCRSQRTSKKKIEEKILNAIIKKIAKQGGSIKKYHNEDIMAELSIEFTETKDRKGIGLYKQPVKTEDKGVDTLDFEEILNQNSEAKEGKPIQMEMFLPSFPFQDFEIFI